MRSVSLLCCVADDGDNDSEMRIPGHDRLFHFHESSPRTKRVPHPFPGHVAGQGWNEQWQAEDKFVRMTLLGKNARPDTCQQKERDRGCGEQIRGALRQRESSPARSSESSTKKVSLPQV